MHIFIGKTFCATHCIYFGSINQTHAFSIDILNRKFGENNSNNEEILFAPAILTLFN